jgi:protein tyrosine phosphatase (PTP) superfamily phosphohydrolase (DUF442 family)
MIIIIIYFPVDNDDIGENEIDGMKAASSDKHAPVKGICI